MSAASSTIPASVRDHYVICNWNDLGDQIIRELHSTVVTKQRPIVIVTDQPQDVHLKTDAAGESDPYRGVFIVPGDPTTETALRRAGIEYADTAIVLSDPREGRHTDAKSVLIALAIESIEQRVHTVVEILDSKNRIHFQHTLVDEVVCVDELTEKLLAQTALTHGLSEFYARLLTATEDTNEIYIVDVPERFVGMTFRQVEALLFDHQEEDVILVGLQTEAPRLNGDRKLVDRYGEPITGRILTINPPSSPNLQANAGMRNRGLCSRDHELRADDRLVLIAYAPPNLA